MTRGRVGLPANALVLIAALAVGATACTGSPPPVPSAAPSSQAAGAVVTATVISDAPTKPETMMPTVPDTGVEQESDAAPIPTSMALDVPAEAERAVHLARKDLAGRLGVALEQILPISVLDIRWRDASLGCPQPGMVYAQVITPGFKVILEAAAQTYEYHTDAGQSIVLCGEEPLAGQEPEAMTSTPAPGQGDLPIFVEIGRVTLLRSAASQSTPVAGRPNDVFAFVASSGTLLLRPGITVAPETDVLIGLGHVIQGPTGDLVRGEVFQLPASDSALLEVIEIERSTGELRLTYSGEVFELSAGQSRTFKRTLPDQTSIEITVVTNRGRLAAIGVLPGERTRR